MALFGKKNEQADVAPNPTPSATGANSDAANSNSEGVFDFNSIARDLEAGDGSGHSFDDLLGQPATNPAANPAFDPEEFQTIGAEPDDSGDLIDLDNLFAESAEPTSVPVAAPNSAAFSQTPPSSNVKVEAKPTETPSPFEPRLARRTSPVVLAALSLLVLGALGAGSYFAVGQMIGAGAESDVAPPSVVAETEPEANAEPNAQASAQVPADAAPQAQPTAPTKVAAAQPQNSAPSEAAPSEAAPLTPQLRARLKDLWEQGADAKHRGDYVSARRFWQQALALRPGHPGFQESINKLPPGAAE